MQSMSRRAIACLLISAPILARTAPVQAQEAATDQESVKIVAEVADAQEVSDRKIVERQGPSERSGFSSPASYFQISTETGTTEVSLAISRDIASTRVDKKDPLRRTSTSTRFTIQGFAPVDKNGGDSFVNISEPLDGARVKLSLVRYVSNYTLSEKAILQARAVLNRAIQNCVTASVAAWQAGEPKEKRELAEKYLKAFIPATEGTGVRAESELRTINGRNEYKDLPADLRDACVVGATASGPHNNGQIIEQYGEEGQVDSGTRAVTSNAPTYFYGLEGTANYKTYSFLDRSGFKLDEEGKAGYQIGAFVGYISGSGAYSLRAGVSHAQKYTAKDPIQFCRPASVVGQSECLSGPDGAPGESKSNLISFEARKLFAFKSGFLADIGVAPELSYDIDSGEISIDFPIYLAPNKDNQLNGGVRFGYGSEKNQFAFGLFVGVPFSLFK